MQVDTYLMYVVLPIICLSLLIIVFRFVKGPHIADRVVALDLLITSGVGLIGIFCLISKDATFLDIATILALIAFLSTIAFSYYLDRGNRK
jgi:multicomponent Na+:H+ antiporter subunit F